MIAAAFSRGCWRAALGGPILLLLVALCGALLGFLY